MDQRQRQRQQVARTRKLNLAEKRNPSPSRPERALPTSIPWVGFGNVLPQAADDGREGREEFFRYLDRFISYIGPNGVQSCVAFATFRDGNHGGAYRFEDKAFKAFALEHRKVTAGTLIPVHPTTRFEGVFISGRYRLSEFVHTLSQLTRDWRNAGDAFLLLVGYEDGDTMTAYHVPESSVVRLNGYIAKTTAQMSLSLAA